MECVNLCLSAKATVSNYQVARNSGKPERQVQNRPSSTQRWEKPGKDYVKVNWDACLDQKKRRMGIGIIVRDEEGKVVAAVCDKKENVEEAAVAESYALRAAVELCSTLNIQKAIFEGDAKEIVMAVCRKEETLTSYGSLVEDVRFYFKNSSYWFIQFAYREKNVVAHTLAKKALSLEGKKVWLEVIPDCIVGYLNSDCHT